LRGYTVWLHAALLAREPHTTIVFSGRSTRRLPLLLLLLEAPVRQYFRFPGNALLVCL
jgi:hypothetical protein